MNKKQAKTDNPEEVPQYENDIPLKPRRTVQHDPIIEARRVWRDAETKLNNTVSRVRKINDEHVKAAENELAAREAFHELVRKANLIPAETTELYSF